MSLDNLYVVDAVGTEADDGTIVLSLIDGWDWSDEQQHLRALQAKLNAYFGFVESGQLYEAYPDAKGRSLRIDVIGSFSIPEVAVAFLNRASAVAAELNLTIRSKIVL